MEPSFRLGFVLSIASLCILSSFSSAVNISEESDSQSQSQYYHGNENVFVTGNRPYLTSQHFRSVNGKPIPERSKVSNPFLRRLAIPSYLKKITKWHSEDLQQLDLFEGVDSVSCRAHVTELFGRIRSPDTDWLAKENAWVIQCKLSSSMHYEHYNRKIAMSLICIKSILNTVFDSWGKIPEGILTGHVNSKSNKTDSRLTLLFNVKWNLHYWHLKLEILQFQISGILMNVSILMRRTWN